jgi:ankyrin repeat protein
MKILKFITIAVILFLAAMAAVFGQEIFDAVKANDTAKVKALLENNPSLKTARDASGSTPLHQAVVAGSVAIAELLLSRGADVNAVNAQLYTPLHEAIRSGKVDMAKLLIEKGADVHHNKNAAQSTPLHMAAWNNQKRIGELLIAAGAVVDSRDAQGRTPFLLLAWMAGNVEFGRLLLQKGADINAKFQSGDMPLNIAAWRGFKEFIEFLLDNGADFYTGRGMPLMMLQWAAGCGSPRLFDAVSAKGGDVFNDERANTTTMRAAIAGGSVEIVKKLLARNIPLATAANRYGWTPAHAAAANGQAPMIEFLAQNGVVLDGRTLSGKSAANLAAENNRKEVLDALARLGADLGPQRFPELKGPYLGQAPPESEPRLFAPDIVSNPDGDVNHGGITFSPDGMEIYWNLQKTILMMKLENGQWTEPVVAPFANKDGAYSDDNPFISPDGKRLFFTSTRPGAVSERKENIWFTEKTSSGWSEPKPVSAEVNALPLHWGISVSSPGTLYFGGTGQESYGRADIYCSRLVKGVYTKPVNLGPVINGKGLDHCPYIAPDESYLIYAKESETGPGFFISFKDKAGRWTPPVKLSGDFEGVCPLISPDGKFFFFNGGGIFWTSAKFIEALRPKA